MFLARGREGITPYRASVGMSFMQRRVKLGEGSKVNDKIIYVNTYSICNSKYSTV